MNYRVLIIDTHPVYTKKTILFLQKLNFQDIHLAETGEKGIAEVKVKTPDLVILSGMLPDQASWTVCREIHQLTYGFTKIIVQIGLFTEQTDIEGFKLHGANAVLERKEKDLMPLQKAIEEALSIHLNPS